MNLSTRAVATASAAAAIAGGAFLGQWELLAVLAALVALCALGWAPLLNLPSPGGIFFVVLLPGLGALAAVQVTLVEPWLRYVPLVLAMGVLLAFINELLRSDGRHRLVESLLGAVSGLVVVVSAAGWVAAYKSPVGIALVVLCAVTLAVASALSATRFPTLIGAIIIIVGATASGIGATYALPDVRLLSGAWVGVFSGALVASLTILFRRLPELEQTRAAIAAIVAPVALGGMFVYVVGRTLIG